MNSTISWLKRQAEVATALGILLGGASAVIIFFGGSIPPWYTPQQARADESVVSNLQKQTIDTLSKLNDKIDSTARRLDQADCRELNISLAQANAVLVKNPNDPIAQALKAATLGQMRSIQNCEPF